MPLGDGECSLQWEAQPALQKNVTQHHPMLENKITTAVAFRVGKKMTCSVPVSSSGSLFFFFLIVFIYSFIFLSAALGLRCCVWAFSSCQELGLLLSCAVWAFHCSGLSYCGAQALGHMGFSTYSSWALEHRLRSCPGAYGIFLDQGLNSCLLHQQSDPLPVNHKRSPGSHF